MSKLPSRVHLCVGLLLPRSPEVTIFVFIAMDVVWGKGVVCMHPHLEEALHSDKEN